MKNIVRTLSILLISLFFLGGCASQVYHDYIMSGQIVTVEGKEVGESGYSREFIGKIRLGEKKDRHFAEAIVLSGDLIRYDMVEFDRD